MGGWLYITTGAPTPENPPPSPLPPAPWLPRCSLSGVALQVMDRTYASHEMRERETAPMRPRIPDQSQVTISLLPPYSLPIVP